VQIPDSVSIRLVYCGTIVSVTRYGFCQILQADQKCDRFFVWCFGIGNHIPELDIRFLQFFRGVRIRIFAVFGSGHHIFQRIDTKFPTELKLSNADFVLSSVVNETRDTNRILGMCKCRFILVHSIDARDAHSIEHSDACLFLIPPSRPNNINNNNN